MTNEVKFYEGFKIFLSDKHDYEKVGRIVTNAAIFNALLGVGLIVSLIVGGEQSLLLKKYLLISIIIAGIVGGGTLKPVVAALQSGPAMLALVLMLLN